MQVAQKSDGRQRRHKKSAERRPLCDRTKSQIAQIIRRPRSVQRDMTRIFGVTFKPGDRSDTFLGKEYLLLESPIMMVQSSELIEQGGVTREVVATFGIKARIGFDGHVFWDKIILSHDLGRKSFPGAYGKVIDPRDAPTGKGDWLDTGLRVDNARRTAARQSLKLDKVPALPEVYLGVADPDRLTFEDTPALRHRVAQHMAKGGKSFHDELTTGEQQMLLRSEWTELWIEKEYPGNNTGLYLISQQYTTQVRRSLRQFVRFDPTTVGEDVHNPMAIAAVAKDVNEAVMENPAKEVAAGLDINETFTDEQANVFLAQVRNKIERADLYEDEYASEALAIALSADNSAQGDYTFANRAAQHAFVRAALTPELSACCTDKDIQHAIDHPAQPLFASGLCGVQVCYTDWRRSRREAFQFDSKALGRDRTSCDLYRESR